MIADNARKKAQKGKNSEIIQQQNRRLVLQLVKEKEITSRVELAHLSGLKQATITNIVHDLLQMDYLSEAGLIEGNNGRRVMGVEINKDKMRVFVVRITASYYAAGIYDVYGRCLDVEKKFMDSYQDFESTAQCIIASLTGYMQGQEEKQFLGLGIVFHGCSSDFRKQYLCMSDAARGMTPLHEMFMHSLQMPTFVNRFSDMAAYYIWEQREREQMALQTLLCLSIGYAVDCALISEGRLIQNSLDAYGEYGHVSIDLAGPKCPCGNRGCIQGYLSVDSVLNMVKEKAPEFPDTQLKAVKNIRDVIRAYYEKDPLALAVYDQVAFYLAVAVVNLFNQFSPEEIIIGDEIPNDDAFLKMVLKHVQNRMKDEQYQHVNLTAFKEERKTQNDVGMKGMCQYIIAHSMKYMAIK